MQITTLLSLSRIDFSLFYLAFFVYIIGTSIFLIYLIKPKLLFAQVAFYFTILGFVFHSTILIYRYFTYAYFPVTNLHQSLFFFAWCLIGIFIIFNIKHKIPVLGSFVTPLACVFLSSSATIFSQCPIPIPPSLRSIWLPIHTSLSFLGEAFFALAFCGGLMYLIQENQIKNKKWSQFLHRLPSLQTLDDLNYLCLCFGFPFLTLGIITGSIWAEYTWGSYWNWDPKETWSLVTWLIYAALLHGRLIIGWRGKRAALFSIFGFAVVLFTFLGVNLFLPGLHSYESLTTPVQ
ncbi:MAG TPA: c-type cytochrome biogenesis protein CcsB [Candidatus Atribacteria bacterium]|nr:c-type cytochrome biogenesis protein CcsB [Candidatus Atribacteria bacterium]